MAEKHNVFISHYGEDEPHLDKLRGRLHAIGCEVRNSSIEKKNYRKDKVEDVIGYGIISVGKYEQKGKVNSKQNWMLRELNKRKIEERNQIITDKPKALLKPLVNNITLPLNETKTPRRLYPSNPRYHKPMSTFKFKSLSPSIDIPSITKTNTTNVDEYINTFKNSLSKLINSN